MNIHIIWVGKTKNKHLRSLQEDYLSRLSHFAKVSISEIKDKSPREKLNVEGNRILKKVNQSAVLCVLDVEGKSIDSKGFAKQIENWQINGIKELTFVIGSAEGLSAEVVERAGFRVSLSTLTLTHEMARVILLEQLYRAHTIIKGFPYQK